MRVSEETERFVKSEKDVVPLTKDQLNVESVLVLKMSLFF